MPNYQDTPTKDLLAIYNGLADKPLKAWKGKRVDLIDRVATLQEQHHQHDVEGLTEDVLSAVDEAVATGKIPDRIDNVVPLDSARPTTPKPTAAEKPAAPKTEPKATGNAARTIRDAALQWLCHAEYYEDREKKSSPDNRVDANHPKARSVGITYLAIVDKIKEEFPGCETSVACLRWYSVKVRAEEIGYEGYRLCQRRPRAKPTRG